MPVVAAVAAALILASFMPVAAVALDCLVPGHPALVAQAELEAGEVVTEEVEAQMVSPAPRRGVGQVEMAERMAEVAVTAAILVELPEPAQSESSGPEIFANSHQHAQQTNKDTLWNTHN